MFAVGYDFQAFDQANYRRDSTNTINIPGTLTGDVLADSAVENFKNEDPQITGHFQGATNQRCVLDLTGHNNVYTDVDFIASLFVNMNGSGVAKKYIHWKHQDNSVPNARANTTVFEGGANAVEVSPAANYFGDPLDTFVDSKRNKFYDTRLVHVFSTTQRIRYLGLNFNKQAGDAVSVGRIIGGKLWKPERQPSVGVQWQRMDSTKINAAPGTFSNYLAGRKYRTLTVQFEYINEAEAYQFDDIFSFIGQAKPIFVIADTENPIRSSMYCRVTSPLTRVEDWIDQQNIGSVTFTEIVPKQRG